LYNKWRVSELLKIFINIKVEPENGCGEEGFMEKVRESNSACESGDYARAIQLYTEALRHYPNNHILYSNRSAALLKLGRFTEALHDATCARQINPNWPKAHYREGVALQCLGRHGDALAVFSTGLSIESKSTQLLAGLIEASIKSPLRGKKLKKNCKIYIIFHIIIQVIL
jgi:tetratricopeptide (TPR) repeat protein